MTCNLVSSTAVWTAVGNDGEPIAAVKRAFEGRLNSQQERFRAREAEHQAKREAERAEWLISANAGMMNHVIGMQGLPLITCGACAHLSYNLGAKSCCGNWSPSASIATSGHTTEGTIKWR